MCLCFLFYLFKHANIRPGDSDGEWGMFNGNYIEILFWCVYIMDWRDKIENIKFNKKRKKWPRPYQDKSIGPYITSPYRIHESKNCSILSRFILFSPNLLKLLSATKRRKAVAALPDLFSNGYRQIPKTFFGFNGVRWGSGNFHSKNNNADCTILAVINTGWKPWMQI